MNNHVNALKSHHFQVRQNYMVKGNVIELKCHKDTEFYIYIYIYVCMYVCMYVYDSLVAQLVKNQPAMQKTLFRFLGWEDPLEKGMATLSSILTWRIPWIV